MSNADVAQPDSGSSTPDQLMSARFAQMILQQSNLAMMLLGKEPHAESGQTTRDLDGAKMFIDQLEMIEAKTKGNLSKEEDALLKQSLMSLRLAYVEAVESPVPGSRKEPAPTKEPSGSAEPKRSASTAADAEAAAEAESRKKFTKKY